VRIDGRVPHGPDQGTTQVLPQVSCFASCGVIQHPLPEEVELHAPIPTPLDQLEAVDLAFHGSGRPWESSRGVHSRRVPLEPLGTVPQFHTRAGTTGVEPGIQVRSLPLADHRRALLYQLLHVGAFGVLLELFHKRLVCCRPRLDVLAQQPGELAGGGQLGRSRCRSRGRVLAMRMDPLGDQGTRAGEAVLPDLAPQAGLICTALCQTCLEVGDRGIDFPRATVATLIRREGLRPDPAADGLGIEATGCSNLAEGLALER
jgi:hypothetical protein